MSNSSWPVSNSNLPTVITWCRTMTPSPSWRCLWKTTTVTFEFASEVWGCWWLPPLLNAGRALCTCQDASACCSVSKAQCFLCLCVKWPAGLKEVCGCENKSGKRRLRRGAQAKRCSSIYRTFSSRCMFPRSHLTSVQHRIFSPAYKFNKIQALWVDFFFCLTNLKINK